MRYLFLAFKIDKITEIRNWKKKFSSHQSSSRSKQIESKNRAQCWSRDDFRTENNGIDFLTIPTAWQDVHSFEFNSNRERAKCNLLSSRIPHLNQQSNGPFTTITMAMIYIQVRGMVRSENNEHNNVLNCVRNRY